MLINNNMCKTCSKNFVCKIRDILDKFDEESKKPLGVDITIDSCSNFEPEDVDGEGE